MNIKQNYITSSSRPKTPLKPIGLVVHDTATPGATAQNEHDYFEFHVPKASAHAFVDWNEIHQLIPWNEVAWHAGHTANYSRIGIELCVPKIKDQDKFNKVWSNAVELFAFLMVNVLKQNVVTKENLMSHAEVSNKWKETDHQDPVEYFRQYGKSVDDFRTAVQVKICEIRGTKENVNVIKVNKHIEDVINVNKQVVSTSKDVQAALIALGYDCGVVDGIVGAKTVAAIKKFQEDNHLGVDGVAGVVTKGKMEELLNR